MVKPKKGQCCKCRSDTPTLHIRQAYYCQECFMFQFVGKYRSILIRLRNGNRKKGKVLLACSGGPSSTALVNLTKNFMHTLPSEKKKIQVVPEAIICHIDESPLFETTQPTADLLRQRVEKDYPNMKYLCHSIDEIFDSKFTKNVEFNQVLKSVQGVENSDYEHFVDTLFKPDTDKQEELKKLFDSIKKTTAKEDLLYHIKMEMLMQVAEREGCTYIFFGDSATRQAIKMISWTAKGRGYSLPLDISVDTEIRGMGIMRPMKDMLSKEIGLYNHFSALQVLPPYNYSTMMPPKSSIDRLTEGFINSLERDFPSTVSTVCRTTLKLTPAKDMDMSRQCAVCMMPYQTGITEWRKHITVAQVPEKAEKETCCKENCCKDTKVDMNQHVCYSCQVDFKDYSPETIERLPGFVHQKVIEQGRQDRLLNEIKDFLINDDE